MVVNRNGENDKNRRNDKSIVFPSGPFIPVDAIPHEIDRLLNGQKKSQDMNNNNRPPMNVKPEEAKAIVMLTQIALILFIFVAVALIFLLAFVACYSLCGKCGKNTTSSSKKKNKRQRRYSLDTKSSISSVRSSVRAIPSAPVIIKSPISSPDSFLNFEEQQVKNSPPEIIVKSPSSLASASVLNDGRDLSLNRSISMYQDPSLMVIRRPLSSTSSSSSMTSSTTSEDDRDEANFNRFPDIPVEVIDRTGKTKF